MRLSLLSLPACLAAASLFLTSCDSTPRERQAAVKDELNELDTLARKGTRKIANLGKAAARVNAANRRRRDSPLDPRQEIAMESQLMGPYSGQIDNLTPADLPAAYAQLVRSARAQRSTWSERDWDYARAVYKRLNDQVKQIRMDLPARDEVRIRARQAEFVALQAGHTAKEIGEAARDDKAAD
ncbi:hypothetical protein GCM10023185_13960 [Hymenobacter saemangeumensis]|uniref:Lipoprotein n=1 Tax=Hymenobacter saemangeumensis TaxID=1084522 RepID=A0ABP8I833_9BACT